MIHIQVRLLRVVVIKMFPKSIVCASMYMCERVHAHVFAYVSARVCFHAHVYAVHHMQCILHA